MRNTAEDGPKRAVRATLVKVLLHRRTDRGMTLLEWASRCVRPGEVHELVVTDRWDPRPGARIDRVGFLGFAEMECGGVVDRGDVLTIGGTVCGTVLGFDGCHLPNHYNILVHAPLLLTGASLGLRPELPVLLSQGAAEESGRA
ncbi:MULTISPECIES: DUF6917 domain-containing protein [Streptomyces]|uniref:DUF6917 domain-containing protein n=1 Tax=Streptomyces TaxID=1883 RepID=UPI00081AF67D|nr:MULTISPECIES: hypothetical protein [unclassified Streptomyces]MYQ51844.1 hypothetical protein [Streptomyces sp. SID4941]SCD69638.1 hypothetical protein GA0115247_111320 [Streptomyces sp. PalvLS-984]SDE19623.1 hypothetical protein F558DRAFT_05734 [Streptomyces sp. AmelKG-A3]